jgi:hypothetical protein
MLPIAQGTKVNYYGVGMSKNKTVRQEEYCCVYMNPAQLEVMQIKFTFCFANNNLSMIYVYRSH